MRRAISMLFLLAAMSSRAVGYNIVIYGIEFKLEVADLQDSRQQGGGAPDPICIVKLQQFGKGGYKPWKETEQLKKTRNPKWSKLFEITWATDGVNKELLFSIYDKDTINTGQPDVLIADYYVDVQELARINNFFESASFTDTLYSIRDNNGQKAGFFHIKHRIASTQSRTDRGAGSRNQISLRYILSLSLLVVPSLNYLLRH